LTLEMSSDRTEVFDNRVRFTVAITNDSGVEAKNVEITHGPVKIYTFSSIPAGETRSLTRDAALSQTGRYQFTASAIDALEQVLTFQSNEVQIAVLSPTPVPVTPPPPPDPTMEPVFVKPTRIPIADSSVAPFFKTLLWWIALPISIVAAVALLASGTLLIIATKKRSDQKKASEAAYDHLERSKRRDYVTPAEPDGELIQAKAQMVVPGKGKHPRDQMDETVRKEAHVPDDVRLNEELTIDDMELPHMKYVRSAFERSGDAAAAQQKFQGAGKSLYDDELYGQDELFTSVGHKGVMYEETQNTDSGYADSAGGDPLGYAQGGYADEYGSSGEVDSGYSDGYGDANEYTEPDYAEPDYTNPQYAKPYHTEPRYAEQQYAEPHYADPYKESAAGNDFYDETVDPYPAPTEFDGYKDSARPGGKEQTPSRRGAARRNAQGTDVGY